MKIVIFCLAVLLTLSFSTPPTPAQADSPQRTRPSVKRFRFKKTRVTKAEARDLVKKLQRASRDIGRLANTRPRFALSDAQRRQFDLDAATLRRVSKALDREAVRLQQQTSGEMTQMTLLKLQDAMNKQQQALQTLSNIMKSQSETASAIIDNMK